MKIAYVVFEGITWLDLIGVYDPLSRLKSMNFVPDLSWSFCSFDGKAVDNYGLGINVSHIHKSLEEYNVVIIPGGLGTRKLIMDLPFLEWIKTAVGATYKVSVCTGSLVWGAAGFLKDKVATTNFKEYETLKPFCKEVKKERIVDDGEMITAGAVSASLDLGLYLCEKWAGKTAANEIGRSMAYNHGTSGSNMTKIMIKR